MSQRRRLLYCLSQCPDWSGVSTQAARRDGTFLAEVISTLDRRHLPSRGPEEAPGGACASRHPDAPVGAPFLDSAAYFWMIE
jgi:hypothetical protein